MRTANLLAEKLKEADFFLDQMQETGRDGQAIRYYFSAFSSAARSVTFVIQSVGRSRELNEFDGWYENVQVQLKNNPLAKYFHDIRTEIQKTGFNPINRGTVITAENGTEQLVHFFSYFPNYPPRNMPQIDVISACKVYMKMLINVAIDFYEQFRNELKNTEFEKEQFFEALNALGEQLSCYGFPPMTNELKSDPKIISYLDRDPMEDIRELVAKY